jgi:hypothetical protein
MLISSRFDKKRVMDSERQSFRGRERAIVLGASGCIDASLFTRQPMDNGNYRKGVEGGE